MLLDVFVSCKRIFLVLEYASRGTLADLYRKLVANKDTDPFMEEAEARYYYHDIMNGLEYLHRHNIAHRWVSCNLQTKRLEGAHQHRRSQGGPGGHSHPQIFRTYSHFVVWEAISQTKYCYSPKIKRFTPPKFLRCLRYCTSVGFSQKKFLGLYSFQLLCALPVTLLQTLFPGETLLKTSGSLPEVLEKWFPASTGAFFQKGLKWRKMLCESESWYTWSLNLLIHNSSCCSLNQMFLSWKDKTNTWFV